MLNMSGLMSAESILKEYRLLVVKTTVQCYHLPFVEDQCTLALPNILDDAKGTNCWPKVLSSQNLNAHLDLINGPDL